MNEYRVTIVLRQHNRRGGQVHAFRFHTRTENEAKLEAYLESERLFEWQNPDLYTEVAKVELLIEDIEAMKVRAHERALRNRAIAREAR